MPWRCALCGRPWRVSVLEFKRMTAYPHGRPGYVIDHIVPLALGGADTPANMQWQKIQAAKGGARGQTLSSSGFASS